MATAGGPAELATERSAGWKAHEMGDIEDVGNAVADELTFDPDVDASGITVRTVDGEVTLAGTVPSYPQYLAATADARRIAGDRNVRNGLEVRLPPGDVRDDTELTTAAPLVFPITRLCTSAVSRSISRVSWVLVLSSSSCSLKS